MLRNKKRLFFICSTIILIIIILMCSQYGLKQKEKAISKVTSISESEDTLSDTEKIVVGARRYINTKPKYVDDYYKGGYPPNSEGVCTDVIWKAYLNAGYNLKDMIDEDIQEHLDLYKSIIVPDPNIDFRRVSNLKIFFENNAESYTLNPYETKEWKAGDIVIFGKDEHIAIISDKKNSSGIPYIIHNGGESMGEEDGLIRLYNKMNITGHYRFILK